MMLLYSYCYRFHLCIFPLCVRTQPVLSYILESKDSGFRAVCIFPWNINYAFLSRYLLFSIYIYVVGGFVAEYKGSAMTVNQWREEEEGLLCLPRLSIYLSKVKLSFLLSPPMSSSLSKTWKSPPLRLDGLEYAWGSNSSPFALGITLHRISSDVIDVVAEGDFKLESPSSK